MFQAQYKETKNSTWKAAVSFKIIMTTIVTFRPCFTTPDLQDQDHSMQDRDQDQDRFFFCSETSLVLRPAASNHITGIRHKAAAAFLVLML